MFAPPFKCYVRLVPAKTIYRPDKDLVQMVFGSRFLLFIFRFQPLNKSKNSVNYRFYYIMSTYIMSTYIMIVCAVAYSNLFITVVGYVVHKSETETHVLQYRSGLQ